MRKDGLLGQETAVGVTSAQAALPPFKLCILLWEGASGCSLLFEDSPFL